MVQLEGVLTLVVANRVQLRPSCGGAGGGGGALRRKLQERENGPE